SDSLSGPAVAAAQGPRTQGHDREPSSFHIERPHISDERHSKLQPKGTSMKIRALSTSLTVMILTSYTYSSKAQTITPDLKAVSDGRGWKGSISAAKLIDKDGAPALEFNKPGENVVWLDGF